MTTSTLEDIEAITERNAPLSLYTTFQLGGPCKGLIHCARPVQLEQAVKYLNSLNEPFIVMGGGSNLVVADEGLDCYVVRYVSNTPLIEREGGELTISGSTLLDDLARYASEAGLEGLNCTTGVPGTVGGAIVGNAGAFGKQIGDVTAAVIVIDKEGNKEELSATDLRFQYRHSLLKARPDIVVSARLKLRRGYSRLLQEEREEILKLRHAKHPDLKVHPCAGSFFKNIEPTSVADKRQAAGWFLEQAGGKELKHGGAQIFLKHANIIIKADGCSSQDIYELSLKMQRLVKEKFNLDLVREVRFVGLFKGMSEEINEIIW